MIKLGSMPNKVPLTEFKKDEFIPLDYFTPVFSSWFLGITGEPRLSLSKGSHTGLLCFCCFMAFGRPQCWQPWRFLKLCYFKPCGQACLKVNVHIWVLGCQNNWVAVDSVFIAWPLQPEVCRITHDQLCELAVWCHTMLVAPCAALRSIRMTRAMIKAGNATLLEWKRCQMFSCERVSRARVFVITWVIVSILM